MFYEYNQNNSGGSFDYDESRGITRVVIVEADTADEADRIAEGIGLYFDGAGDCPCCGDRWSEASSGWGSTDGSVEPTIYGKPASEYDVSSGWMDKGREIVIHYKNGTKKWY